MTVEMPPVPPPAHAVHEPIEQPSEATIARIFDGVNMPNRLALEPTNFDDMWRLAVIVSRSGLYKLGDENTAFLVLQAGKEMGLTAVQSLRGLYSFDGRLAMFADTMVALIRTSGKCAYWRPIGKPSKDECTMVTLRVGAHEEPMEVQWTREQAESIIVNADGMRLTEKDNWLNNPRGMLRHRCEAELARAAYQDVIMGIHTPDELESIIRRVDLTQNGRPRASTVSLVPGSASITPVGATGRPLVFGERDPNAKPPPSEAEIRAMFDNAKTQDEFATARKATPPAMREAIKPAMQAAKARLEAVFSSFNVAPPVVPPPPGPLVVTAPPVAPVAAPPIPVATQAPPVSGVQPVASTPAPADAAPPPAKPQTVTEYGAFLASLPRSERPSPAAEDRILDGWVAFVLCDTNPEATAARHASFAEYVPEPVRMAVWKSTVRRLVGLGLTEAAATVLIDKASAASVAK